MTNVLSCELLQLFKITKSYSAVCNKLYLLQLSHSNQMLKVVNNHPALL